MRLMAGRRVAVQVDTARRLQHSQRYPFMFVLCPKPPAVPQGETVYSWTTEPWVHAWLRTAGWPGLKFQRSVPQPAAENRNPALPHAKVAAAAGLASLFGKGPTPRPQTSRCCRGIRSRASVQSRRAAFHRGSRRRSEFHRFRGRPGRHTRCMR